MPLGIDLWGLQFAPPPLPDIPEGSSPRFHERFPSYKFQPPSGNNNNTIGKERGGLEVLTGYGPASSTMDLSFGSADGIIDEFHVPSSANKSSWMMDLAESLGNLASWFVGGNKGEAKLSKRPRVNTNSSTPSVIWVEEIEDPGFRDAPGVDTMTSLSKVTFSNDSVAIRNSDHERRHGGVRNTRQS